MTARSVPWWRIASSGTEMFGCGCSSLGRDAQLAELASVNAELRAKLGLLMIDDDPVLHVEWGLRYDQLPHDVVFGREAMNHISSYNPSTENYQCCCGATLWEDK